MLRKVVIVLGVVVVVLAVIIATRPSTFRVERSTRIAAPPDVVFGLVNDFHAWDRWSPWAKLDPGMKTTYGGPSVGQGATYAWSGNDNFVGKAFALFADMDAMIGKDFEKGLASMRSEAEAEAKRRASAAAM